MQTNHVARVQTNSRQTIIRPRFVYLGLIIISVSLVILSIFGMASWAEISTAHHAVQHVVLFIGGVGVGTSLTRLLKGAK